MSPRSRSRFPSLAERVTISTIVNRRVRGKKALRVCYFIGMWGSFMERQGADVGIEAFIREYSLPRQTAYLWQREFREAFPEYSTPAPIWKLIRPQVDLQASLDDLAFQIAASEIVQSEVELFPRVSE